MRLWDNLAFVTDNKRFTCPPRNGALRALTVGAVGRFAVGGRAGGHRGGSPWPWYGALTASALEPTNGGERRAKKIPLRATGPLRKPHVLRFRNTGGAGAPTLRNMAIWAGDSILVRTLSG